MFNPPPSCGKFHSKTQHLLALGILTLHLHNSCWHWTRSHSDHCAASEIRAWQKQQTEKQQKTSKWFIVIYWEISGKSSFQTLPVWPIFRHLMAAYQKPGSFTTDISNGPWERKKSTAEPESILAAKLRGDIWAILDPHATIRPAMPESQEVRTEYNIIISLVRVI